VVMVCRPTAKVQPQASSEKLCQDGAVKRSWNNSITKVPNDEARKGSTAMSSNERVRMREDYLTGVDVAVAR
jgi:hypothetical protein